MVNVLALYATEAECVTSAVELGFVPHVVAGVSISCLSFEEYNYNSVSGDVI